MILSSSVVGPVHHQANLALRFVLELCALAAFFYWGLWMGESLIGVALGLIFVIVAAAMWGVFASPRARISLALAGRLVVEAAFFGSAAVGLISTGHPMLGVLLLGLAIINRILIFVWKQDEAMREQAGQHGRIR